MVVSCLDPRLWAGIRAWAHSRISLKGVVNDRYCLADMRLHALEEARIGFLGQEGVDLCLELAADLAQRERGGGARSWRLFNPAIRDGRDAVGEMVVWHHSSCVCERVRIVSCYDRKAAAMDTPCGRC